jgi:hypothetical protein
MLAQCMRDASDLLLQKSNFFVDRLSRDTMAG